MSSKEHDGRHESDDADEAVGAVDSGQLAGDGVTPVLHKQLAVRLFNTVWDLLLRDDRSADDDAMMVHSAHASVLHWSVVGTPVNLVRGEWQCSRVYAVLGRAEPALYHAVRCLALCERHGIGGFDLAASHEAMARASAAAGDNDGARRHAAQAASLAESIGDADERSVIEGDLRTLPIGDAGAGKEFGGSGFGPSAMA